MNDKDHFNNNKKKWDSRSETYDNNKYDYFRFFQKRALSLMKLKENHSFLDIGCGTGWAVIYAASIIKETGKCFGIDLSPGMIKKAFANSSRNGIQNAQFYVANAETLPFENNLFDYVLCSNSFHHYPHPIKALKEIKRVLKINGRLYLMDLTRDGFIVALIDQKNRQKEKEHVKFYSTKEFKELFNNANLIYLGKKGILGPEKVHIGQKN